MPKPSKERRDQVQSSEELKSMLGLLPHKAKAETRVTNVRGSKTSGALQRSGIYTPRGHDFGFLYS